MVTIKENLVENNCNCDNNCKICGSDSSGSSSINNSSSGSGSAPKDTAGIENLKDDVYKIANENQVSGSVPGTVIMDVLASIQSVIPDVVNSVSNIVGYMTEIWYPFGTSSVYGKNSNKIRYTAQPQVRSSFIGANLFTQANAGVFDGSEFSTFVGEAPYLLTFNYRIPENSKVKIYYGTSCRWMKVRRHEEMAGANGPMMIFNFLSPCTSAGELIEDEPTPDETSDLVVDPINAEGTVKSGQNLI